MHESWRDYTGLGGFAMRAPVRRELKVSISSCANNYRFRIDTELNRRQSGVWYSKKILLPANRKGG